MSGHTYLIDASIYIFQAYFSPYSTAVSEEDEDVSAFVGFLQFLLSLQRREQPARGAVAMDNALFSGFRHQLSAEYKSNRELPDDNLAWQLGLCAEAALALGWPVYASERFEADDIIGTLAHSVRSEADEGGVCIVSKDKDLAQLIKSEQDVMWDFTANRRRNRFQLEKDMGVPTSLIPDYLGLVGDAVDCIAGVPGIGPVKARALIAAFGSIEALYADLGRVAIMPMRGAKALAAKLEAFEEQARLCKVLATVVEQPQECDEEFAVASLHNLSLQLPDSQSFSAVLAEARLPRGLSESLGNLMRSLSQSEIGGAY